MNRTRDVLTMTWFGRFGRAGNQIIQYMFLRNYAQQHGLKLMLPSWDAAALFGARHRAPGCTAVAPRL